MYIDIVCKFKITYKVFVIKTRIYIVCKKVKKVNFSSEFDFLTYYVNCGSQTIANILQIFYKIGRSPQVFIFIPALSIIIFRSHG